MDDKEQLYTIILRHDTSTQWMIQNPVLEFGEYGVEDDTHRVKRGDGQTKWADLIYETFGIIEILQEEIKELQNTIEGILNAPYIKNTSYIANKFVYITRNDGVTLMARVLTDYISNNTEILTIDAFMKDVEEGKISLVGGNGEVGTINHNDLLNRDMEDQHPIESITNLREILNTIPSIEPSSDPENAYRLGSDGKPFVPMLSDGGIEIHIIE